MAIGKIVKEALRKAYKAKTAPLQAANRVARTIAPNTKIATALAAAASPKILASSAGKGKAGAIKKGAGKVAQKGGTTERTPPSKPTAKRIKGNAARRGTYTSRKRTGEGDQGSYSNIMPTMGMPGDDMSTIARRPNRARRMKAGGLAIKGQGKAFLKSKR